MFVSSISWKKNHSESHPNDIVLCAFIVIAVVWTLLFFNTENDFKNYIFIVIFIVLVLGVNGALRFGLEERKIYE